MAVPAFEELFLPFLRFVERHGQISLADARDILADDSGLTDEGRQELLPSGRQGRYDNRVGWGRTYLGKAGLIHTVRRGFFALSESGRQLLAVNPPPVNLSTIFDYEPYRQWTEASRNPWPTVNSDSEAQGNPEDQMTPEESTNAANSTLRQSLASDIAETIQGVTWSRVGQIVSDVVRALGFGGNRAGAGHAFRKGGDEGVDGVINEDRLGLSKTYAQAKKHAPDRRISRHDVQAFVGSLTGQNARQGVFITASGFTNEALAYVDRLSDRQVALITGELLAEYMMDYNVGVSEKDRFVVKKIDVPSLGGASTNLRSGTPGGVTGSRQYALKTYFG